MTAGAFTHLTGQELTYPLRGKGIFFKLAIPSVGPTVIKSLCELKIAFPKTPFDLLTLL
jgi:hypothetical protein